MVGRVLISNKNAKSYINSAFVKSSHLIGGKLEIKSQLRLYLYTFYPNVS